MSFTKTTDVDFHLNVEETPSGGALILAQWSVRMSGTSFTVDIQTVTEKATNEAISFMSDLQRHMVDKMKTWGEIIGSNKTTP